jgi:peroxiredoxin family protein
VGVFSVVLYGNGKDRLYEAVSFLAAARARGESGLLFLRGPALRSHASGRWAAPATETPREGFRFGGRTSQELLEDLRSAGLRVYACSAWARLLRLDPGVLARRVDAVVGLNAFLSQAAGGPLLTF